MEKGARYQCQSLPSQFNKRGAPPPLESGCIQSLVGGSVCSLWSQQKLDIMRADGETLHSQGSGTITLMIDNANPVKADNLVMDSLLIGFNMLIWMDSIKILGGVSINQSGEAIFSRTDPCVCIAMRIEEPDFSAEFDEQTRVWTVWWKWSVITHLMNLQTGHLNIQWLLKSDTNTNMSCIRGWIMKSCFPLLRRNLAPKGLIPLMAVFQ